MGCLPGQLKALSNISCISGVVEVASSSGNETDAGPAIQEGSWVLDLATGTGNVALAAAAKIGSTGRVLGIDISDKFLEIASNLDFFALPGDLEIWDMIIHTDVDIDHLNVINP